VTTIYTRLAERIRDEVETLGQITDRALNAWEKARNKPSEQAYVDSVALNLHGIYAGVERLFELIARHIDGGLPDGAIWHRDLLHQMAHDVADVRPAVIGDETAERLDELRRFRHLVRNVYTMNLEPEKMGDLISDLPTLWSRLRLELLAFADFLEQLATEKRIGENQ
jgi:hypothetical protein